LDKKTVRGLLRNPSPHIGLAALETENINSMFSDAALNNIIVPITRRVFDAFKSEDAVKIKGVWEEYQSLLNTLERNQDLITILEMKTVKELFTIAHMTRSLDGRAFKKVARILVKKEDWESNTKFFERAYKEISAADLGSDTGPLKKKIEDRLAKRYRSVHRDNRNFKTPS